jgi:uncharacterized 2Fe-2S/4Fe-4S cluster protein (DUF4445 family)
MEGIVNMDDMVRIIFQPSGKRGKIKKGTTLLEASRELGVDIENLCGGQRVCGKCKVRIEEGFFQKLGVKSSQAHVTPCQDEEGKFINQQERSEGFRLSCCARITGDLLVYVPEESQAGKQVVSKAARELPITNNPAVKLYYVELPQPTMDDPLGDFERLCRGLEHEHNLYNLSIDILALRDLPERLREGDWKVTASVWMEKEIIKIRPGSFGHHYGMAIDIGTTTIAAFLCDLKTNAVVDTRFFMNPQCKYGENVMSRVTYHNLNQGGLQKMSHDLLEELNKAIEMMTLATHPLQNKEKKVKPHPGREKQDEKWLDEPGKGKQYPALTVDDIEDVTIVGNTAMHHIFFQLNPKHLSFSPFPPVIHSSLDLKARDLGLKVCSSAYVHVLPIEAGFVGADNVGVLIAEKPHKRSEVQLIIDIGTNGELVLGNQKKLISSSCATGPALEGAQITFGMRAAPGAIERIILDPDTHEVDYKVVGRDAWKSFSQSKAMQCKGICGSGILDVLAEFYRTGIITKSGAFNQTQRSDRYRHNPESRFNEFVIAWASETSIGKDIVISQKDIRQIQLAKSAIYSGCKLMIKRMGVEKVDLVKIAGAFGNHVDKLKALIMGLFPDIAIDKILCVGNAAGDGARLALLDRDMRIEAQQVAQSIEYIELTADENFQQEFMEAIEIPHASDSFPHLEDIIAPEILYQD